MAPNFVKYRSYAEAWRRIKIAIERGYYFVACVDLFTDTAEPDTGQLAARYSNDGLYLTTEGYERLAILLYEQVFAAACR